MAGDLHKLRIAALVLGLALAACAGHGTSPPGGDGLDATDDDADAALADVDAKPDTAKDAPDTADAVDVADTATSDASPDTDADVAQNCPGSSFCACTSDSDCDSGKCLETPEGHTCAPTCVEAGCPAGYQCKPLGSGDPVNYCVSSHLSTCAPCSTNKDCQTQGVTDSLCIDYGDVGHFCGGACKVDTDCGGTFACVDVPDPVGGGKTVKQCKAKSNSCDCSVWAKTAGTITACSNANSAGICTGTRTCTATGLTACSAKTPAAETCNNQDDDCNGTADDLPADATCANLAWSPGSGTACTTNADCTIAGERCKPGDGTCQGFVGSCVGKHVCVGGADVCQASAPKAEVCNGADDNCDGVTDEGFAWSGLAVGSACGTGACAGGSVACVSFAAAGCSSSAKASAEVCNGLDDDCNGTSDEATCGDANPCTADLCEGATGTCQHLAVEAACDDGNPCTLADACSGTTCVGSASICDDGNPCTTDTCDGKTGACSFGNQPGSCTDGNACTSGDSCGAIAGGGWGCLPGGVVNCDDSNPCTDDSCDLASGCTYTTNSYTQTCYDGAAGTAGKGLCQSGLRYCVGGVLASTCQGEVLPVIPEPCNGLDDSCNGLTDEGCAAATVTLSFAAAQVTGSSGTLTANLQVAPDRPALTLQDPGVPHTMALGVLAWFIHLVTGN